MVIEVTQDTSAMDTKRPSFSFRLLSKNRHVMLLGSSHYYLWEAMHMAYILKRSGSSIYTCKRMKTADGRYFYNIFHPDRNLILATSKTFTSKRDMEKSIMAARRAIRGAKIRPSKTITEKQLEYARIKAEEEDTSVHGSGED